MENLVKLTEREAEVTRLICAGLNNREIADKLFLSVATVEHYQHLSKDKFGCGNRGELRKFISLAWQSGYGLFKPYPYKELLKETESLIDKLREAKP